MIVKFLFTQSMVVLGVGTVFQYNIPLLGPFYGAIAVPSVTRCRCCRCCGHRCAGGVQQLVATPGEWQCKIRRRAAARSGEWA